MPKFRISDTITYERTWVVDAATEEEALDKAVNEGPPEDDSFEENQVDNSPFEVELEVDDATDD